MRLPLEIDSGRLLRLAIIASVFSISAVLGLGILPISYKYIIVALGGIALSILALKDMGLALTILVISAATVPFSIGTGTQSSINIAMLLVMALCGIWILNMVVSRKVSLQPSSLNLPMLAFLVSALVSWIATFVVIVPGVTLPNNILVVQAGQYILFALTFGAYFLTANHPISEHKLIFWTVFIVLAGIGITMIRTFTSHYAFLSSWAGGLLMWPFVLLLGQILFNPIMKLWLKIAGIGGLVFWGYWVITNALSYKSAWAPAAGAFLLLIFFKSKRIFLGICLLLIVTAFAVGLDRISNSLLAGEDYSANPLRWALWVDVFRLGARSALIGLGPATYIYYWNDPGFESLSYSYVSPYAFARDVYAPPAHNMYADIFAQTGAVGLLLFIWVIIAGIGLGFHVLKRSLSPFQRAYAYSILAGFASLSVASFVFAEWLLPYVYNLGLAGFSSSVYAWLLLGTLVTLGVENKSTTKVMS